MFKPNTVFVIGAAASFGITPEPSTSSFPVGAELKARIAECLSKEYQTTRESELSEKHYANNLYFALTRQFLGGNPNWQTSLLRAGHAIGRGIPFSPSIDNFLNSRQDDELIGIVGKAAIAKIILDCERSCSDLHQEHHDLSNNMPSNARRFDGAWHQLFAEACFAGATKSSLPEALSRFQLISFNYDRCFEQFMTIALSDLYELSPTEVDQLTRQMRVHYPYGSLGKLKDLSFGAKHEPSYGKLIPAEHYIKSSQNIRTFTESREPDDETQAIHSAMTAAEQVCFLGFSYGEQNLTLLTSTNKTSRDRVAVYGTAYGLSAAARADVQHKLKMRFVPKSRSKVTPAMDPVLESMTCYDFMRSYLHTLTE